MSNNNATVLIVFTKSDDFSYKRDDGIYVVPVECLRD